MWRSELHFIRGGGAGCLGTCSLVHSCESHLQFPEPFLLGFYWDFKAEQSLVYLDRRSVMRAMKAKCGNSRHYHWGADACALPPTMREPSNTSDEGQGSPRGPHREERDAPEGARGASL